LIHPLLKKLRGTPGAFAAPASNPLAQSLNVFIVPRRVDKATSVLWDWIEGLPPGCRLHAKKWLAEALTHEIVEIARGE
jgi:hypothetical protein